MAHGNVAGGSNAQMLPRALAVQTVWGTFLKTPADNQHVLGNGTGVHLIHPVILGFYPEVIAGANDYINNFRAAIQTTGLTEWSTSSNVVVEGLLF